MRKFSVCLIFFLVLFVLLPNFGGNLLASSYKMPEVSEAQTNEALQKVVPIRFLPNSPFYILIVIKEKIGHFFQPSSLKRSEFSLILSGKRLKETLKLIDQGNIDAAAKNLARYEAANRDVIWQIQKAKGQNQEVKPYADEVAESLNSQETLLAAILAKAGSANNSDFDENFEKTVGSFVDVAMTVNQIKPGLKDRYKIVIYREKSNQEATPKLEATPESEIIQATSSVKPKRVIY